MTDFDASLDIPVAASPAMPGRPGVWRAASIIAVAAAVVIAVLSVLQARAASDVPAPERAQVPLEDTVVTVSDLPVPANAQVSVLGLPEGDSRRSFDPGGTELQLPRGLTAVVALTNADNDNDLVGLAVTRSSTDRSGVEISARSTAHALLLLSPAALRPNLEESFAQVEVVENDPSFEALVQAIRANPSLSGSNETLEAAYAAIADRIKLKTPAPDQGCDSVAARDAYPAAGACAQPQANGIAITNEQDRWALLFSATVDYSELCGVLAPTRTDGDEAVIAADQCRGSSLLVAPGPVTDQGDNQALIEQRVRLAAAYNILYDYAGPFADLAGGSAGFNSASNLHLLDNSQEIVAALGRLLDNEEFAAASELHLGSSTPADRHLAAAAATRLIIDTSDTTNLIPQRAQGNSGHLELLGFYARAAERMTSPRSDWRWESGAIGFVEFGSDT